jgi:hypothetical protein
VGDLDVANLVLEDIQANYSDVFLPCLDRSKGMDLVVCCDSSHDRTKGTGQRCCYFMVCEKHDMLGGRSILLAATSKKIRRKANSSMMAELLSQVSGIEEGERICQFLSILLAKDRMSPADIIELTEAGELAVKMKTVTDCRDLYDATMAPVLKESEDATMPAYLARLRECFVAGRIRERCWCDTTDMIADVGTKLGAPRDVMLKLHRDGWWTPINSYMIEGEAVREEKSRQQVRFADSEET